MKTIDSEWYLLDHVTAPFVKAQSIKDMIDGVCVEGSPYDSGFAAYGIRNFLWINGNPVNFDITDVPRTQDLDTVYIDKCGPYLFSREGFKATGRRIGFKPFIKELSFRESIDIDTREDFLVAEKFSSD